MWKPDSDFIKRRFEHAAAIMGWPIEGDCFTRAKDGTLVANVGHVFLRQRGRSNCWTIIRMSNKEGGESYLRPPSSSQELCAFFEGISTAHYHAPVVKPVKKRLKKSR